MGAEKFAARYSASVADLPTMKGRRNAFGLPRAAFFAVLAGVSVEQFADDVGAACPGPDGLRAADVRRAYASASRKIGAQPSRPAYVPKPKKGPPNTAGYVRALIRAGGGRSSSAELLGLSPFAVRDLGPSEQRRAFFGTLWRPEEFLFCFSKATRGVLGETVRQASAWATASDLPGEVVTACPLSGAEGVTVDGAPSLVAASCVCRWPYIVLEFDDLPLEEQAAFWVGFVRSSRLRLAALVYSGGKSLHGLVGFGAPDVFAADALRREFVDLFASDPSERYRADAAAMRPRTGVRVPGVARKGGRLQRLVYLDPSAAVV